MDLFKEQQEIEARMADRGIERYNRLAQAAKENGDATSSKGVQTVLDSAIVGVAEAIDAFKAEATTGKAGRRHTAIKRLGGIDTTEAAFVALRIALDSMAKSLPVTPIALAIGNALELEARMNAIAEEHPKYVKKLMEDLDSRTRNVGHRRAVLAKVLREKEEKWNPWGKKDNLQTGLKLIELIVSATGLFEVRLDRDGKTQIAVLAPTERFKAWLHSLDTRFALMAPEHLPCVIPPKDWTDNTTGGYHTDALAYPPTLVKTSSKAHKMVLKRANLSKVFSAVNAIQRTPWAINNRVLDVARVLIEAGRPVAKLPDMENTPLPARPVNIDTDEEALKGWKREAARTYEGNRKLAGRRVGVLKTLEIAKEFAHYDAIYFPHQLDFRGRVYPIPQGLNPQGNDLTKGLLHFAEGDPLGGVKGRRWFLIQGANTYGVDKVSFADRVKWVEDNAENIIRSAENPLDHTWWQTAGDPFCFLAWAFEFSDWTASGCSDDFVSRIAVAMDGSCNGLQHYSAMLRDPRGGAATNLLPSDTPQDIYGEVAKVAQKRLDRDPAEVKKDAKKEEQENAISDAVFHVAWRGYGLTRAETKRPVMVLPYGGTQRSCLDYVYEAVKDRGGYPFTDEQLHKATVYLGGVVWKSINEVVTSATLAMGWLKAVASAVSKENLPIIWTTPVGFPVVQAYPQMDSTRIECLLFGDRFVPRMDVASETEIDKRRQANGVAPNFVHSMDASALMATVNHAAEQGVTKFAMIHDSYGTTAGQTAILAESLREAFVSMYEENDVLANFLQEVVPAGIRDSIPTAPFVGGLDLQSVKESLYFFA